MSQRPNRISQTLTILLIVAVVAASIVSDQYPKIREARIKKQYDAQKQIVAEAVEDFVRQLVAEGFHVQDDSQLLGGSGEWRWHVAITATKGDEPSLLGYIEVQGFVSHDRKGSPDWMEILPMVLSKRNKSLDDRFVSLLSTRIEQHKWEFTVDSNCKHFVFFEAYK